MIVYNFRQEDKTVGIIMDIVTIVFIFNLLKEAYTVACSAPELYMCDCVGTTIYCLNVNINAIPSGIPSNTTTL